MWSDNETTTDLLGFDYLVDSLLVLLEEPKLLPLTVGVAGDWGSGKSSLMRMAERALGDREDVVCVAFSPWRFEGYEDVKSALMATVLSAVESRIERSPTLKDKLLDRAKNLGRNLNIMSGLRAGGAAVAALHGLPPEAAIPLTTAASALVDRGSSEERDELETAHTIGTFRDEFAALVGDMDDLTAVIVFIDDLDRCLPPAIVDTFEAIRLFLHVPKTAYVIAHTILGSSKRR
jgi:predicted KAP-like P-loop ATPase